MTLNLLPPARPGYAPVPEAAAAALRGSGVDAIYVHVPFCSSKCHYCDFYSLAGHMGEADAFLDAFSTELALSDRLLMRGVKPRPETIFIGGGTPTLLDPRQLERLLTLIGEAIDPSRLSEFTVEANPNTFDAARARVLADHGVNRISFGAQSFVASELATLQRDHDPESVAPAVEIAERAGINNFNIDLIFGIPGQTLATLHHSLDRALALSPRHLSVYSLIYEPTTAMTARLKRGEFAAMDEDLELAMFDAVDERLRASGRVRYEISNHALPGFECRHNVHYWKASNWLAWGPAAAGHIGFAATGNWRWKNVASLAHYMDALSGEGAVLPWTGMEHLEAREWAAEAATFWLRLAGGIEYAEFAGRTGLAVRGGLERVLRKYEELGLAELTGTGARLTAAAIPVSNRIFSDVLAGFMA